MQTSTVSSSVAGDSNCSTCIFQRGYRLLIGAASMLQSPLLLALRLYWGWQFFGTGKGKLMNHEKVTTFFQSLHIPMASFNVYLAGSTECFGGLLLLVGLGSRLVCLPLLFTLCIAYVTAESDSLKVIFSDPDKFLSATPFLFMLACLVVLAFGPGKFSIDWILQKTVFARKECKESPGIPDKSA
jgi:putative oxidoreductase